MAIKYDGAVFDSVEELVAYKEAIEGKKPEKVVIVQERKPAPPQADLSCKQRKKMLKDKLRTILENAPHKYNLTQLAEMVHDKKVKGGLITEIKGWAKGMGILKSVKMFSRDVINEKPVETQVFRKYKHRDYSVIADKLKVILKTEPKKYNYAQLTSMFFSDNTGCSALKISKLVKQLGLESSIRKGKYKAHTMGEHKVSDYDRFIRARAMEIMKAQKVDYISATKLAMADYKTYKQHKMPAPPQPAKPLEEHPFPHICDSDGMLRMVVRDLLRKNIDNINSDYADNICVKDWTDFLAEFMMNSGKIARHFNIEDKFVAENGNIFYRG